ncbi:MAG: ankyrin repeat domain-containing protein, partial [Armatimonadota bacterium]|nr:ankyrin repeat domain-containing protein [Armatimonadota bacterium]
VIWTAQSGGWTALMLAACGNHQEVAEMLAAQGAKFNNVAGDGNTALSWAALKGHSEMVAWLLAHGVDPRIKNKAGHTALDLVQARKSWLLVYPKPINASSVSRSAWLYDRLSQSRSSPGWTPTDWIRFRAGQYDRTIRLLQHASQ